MLDAGLAMADVTDMPQALGNGATAYQNRKYPDVKTLHAALLSEAEAERVSLNQLCAIKLAAQL